MSVMENMAVCDLRFIKTPEEARCIELIENVALLIVPEDASDETMAAITAIPKENIGMTLPLAKNVKVNMLNGCQEITDGNFNGEAGAVLVVNGIGVLGSVSPETKGIIIANGIIIINEKYKSTGQFTFPAVNGLLFYATFDSYKLYPNKLSLDADMLGYIQPGMALIAGNKIEIGENVTVEMLKNSDITLVAGNKVVCRREIAGYVKIISTVGNKVEITGEEDVDE